MAFLPLFDRLTRRSSLRSAAAGPLGARLSLFGAAAAVLLLAALCVRYLATGAYLDHIESNVLIGGWEYLHGTPLYAMRDGAPRLASYYGPLAYLAAMPAMLALGASVAASKVTAILAAAATVAVMGVHFGRRAPAASACASLMFLVGGMLLFSPVSFWVRPDPFETLLTAAAVVSAPNPLWVGLWLGLAVNCKVHAFAYFLPVLFDIGRRRGVPALRTTALAAAIVFLLPFCLPGISLGDYILGLAQQVGGRAPSAAQIGSIAAAAAALGLPVAAALASDGQPRDRGFAIATMASFALLLYPASFPGAGAYHFLPLVPVIAEARSRLQPQGRAAELALFASLLIAAPAMLHAHQLIDARRGWDRFARAALAVAERFPRGAVTLGYGDNVASYQRIQLARAVLAFNGYPPAIDAQVLMELQRIGIDGSARWTADLEHCRIRAWLLPSGERPFAVTSYFYDGSPLFDTAFRRAFFANYQRMQTDRAFDVWGCRRPP